MKGLKTLPEIIKPVVFVTKTIKIEKLLRTLQKKQSHMAIVVDEHGGTLGIVTIEDIVEELVGEIWDEHDEVVEPVKKEKDESWTVLGSVHFGDMLKTITAEKQVMTESHNSEAAHSEEYKIDEEEIPDTTVANWIMETLGRLPRSGESLCWKNLTIKVLRVIKQRVMEVKVIVNED